MFKLFGYNVLTDDELKKVKEDHWEEMKTYLKIKDLWLLYSHYENKPKCNACDENRKIAVTLPDGSTTKVSCSCASSKITYGIEKSEKRVIVVKGEGIYLTSDIGDYNIQCRVIRNEKELKKADQLLYCYYPSEKLAKKALKIVERKTK